MEGARIPPSLQDGFSIWTINQPRCGWLISGYPCRDEQLRDLHIELKVKQPVAAPPPTVCGKQRDMESSRALA
jgi:hypothetical protein